LVSSIFGSWLVTSLKLREKKNLKKNSFASSTQKIVLSCKLYSLDNLPVRKLNDNRRWLFSLSSAEIAAAAASAKAVFMLSRNIL